MIGTQALTTRTLWTLDTSGNVTRIEEPLPPPGHGQVLVRIHASMVSAGTQVRAIQLIRRGEAPAPAHPIQLGYQAAGEILAVGDGVTRLRVGDRIGCFGIGAQHADFGVVHQNLCVKLPDAVSYVEASGMNLVLTAMHAVRRAEAALGEYMLVVGLGVVGQLAGQFARADGLYVMGWDALAPRLDMALKHSADAVADPRSDDLRDAVDSFTDGLGFDHATLAIGGNGDAALEQVKSVMKTTPDGHAMGHIIMVGGLTTTSSWGAGMGNLELRSSARTGPGYHDAAWELGDAEYPAVFVRWSTQNNLKLAVRMMKDRRIDIDSLITHRLPLHRADEAIDLLVDRGQDALGVVLTSDEFSA